MRDKTTSPVSERMCGKAGSSDLSLPPGGTGKLVCPWTLERASHRQAAFDDATQISRTWDKANKFGGATRPTSHVPFATCSGFTLIEVIAALAVVSIGLLGLLRLHLMNLRTAGTAETTALAVFLAQEKMAEATCAGWPTFGAGSGTVQTNGSEFNWRTEVTNLNSLAPHGIARNTLRQLDVDVTWRQGAGAKSLRMTTYVADTRIP